MMFTKYLLFSCACYSFACLWKNKSSNPSSFTSFCFPFGAGDQVQGLTHTNQELYDRTKPLVLLAGDKILKFWVLKLSTE